MSVCARPKASKMPKAGKQTLGDPFGKKKNVSSASMPEVDRDLPNGRFRPLKPNCSPISSSSSNPSTKVVNSSESMSSKTITKRLDVEMGGTKETHLDVISSSSSSSQCLSRELTCSISASISPSSQLLDEVKENVASFDKGGTSARGKPFYNKNRGSGRTTRPSENSSELYAPSSDVEFLPGLCESGVAFDRRSQTTAPPKEEKKTPPTTSRIQQAEIGSWEAAQAKRVCCSPSELANEKTSGSGSDGGYAGSASSNSQLGTEQSSLSSSEEAATMGKSSKSSSHSKTHGKHHSHRSHEKRQRSSFSSSSDIADFSSSASVSATNAGRRPFAFSTSMYSSSSNGDGSSDEWEAYPSKKTKRKKSSSTKPESTSGPIISSSSKPGRFKKRGRLQVEKENQESSPSHNHASVVQHSNVSTEKPDKRTTTFSKSFPREMISKATTEQSVHKGALHGGMSILEKSFQRKIERSTKKRHGHHQHRRRHTQDLSLLPLSLKKSSNEGAISSACSLVNEETPIYSLGADIMAQCLCFLEPVEVYSVLSMPLSKMWRSTLTIPQDLWKVLCHLKPFHAKVDEETSSDEPMSPFPICSALEVRHMFGRYRLLYTSFIRCVRYLAQIKDDAIKGKPPSTIGDVGGALGHSGALAFPRHHDLTRNSNLKDFFARAGRVVRKNRRKHSSANDGIGNGGSSSSSSNSSSSDEDESRPNSSGDEGNIRKKSLSNAVTDKPNADGKGRKRKREAKLKFSHSSLTEKLLGPSKSTGDVGSVELPWSCAIYSIVNWMVAFSDVEGIQIMCLQVLPFLLEDENQRTTAQRAGLTDIVLRAMVIFPDSVELHTAAFHTLVLLARPLGGKEGMLFHSAMVNSSGIFNVGSNAGRNGIAVMLDSMRRFAHDEVLQAMSCWSMVNIALMSSQKTMLVKLGGISVAANAMMQHPYNAEVQFRALFALINLVIPSDSSSSNPAAKERQVLGDVSDMTEREMLDENVGQIANLVVVAMKNFCSSEAILNRACLVLHNLSLSESYHTTLLWTPNCYQMLEWCIGNYRHDNVLQQSAGGTLQRLQTTLANNSDLRARFTESMLSQRQNSIEQT